MAKESEGMDTASMDELYGGEDGAKGGEEGTVDDQAQTSSKALLPLTVLQSSPTDKVEVGDERVVKVVAIHGEEAEVIYAPKEGEGHDEKSESGPAELDRMDQEETAETMGNPGNPGKY